MCAFFSSFRLFPLLGWTLLVLFPLACVDPEDIVQSGTNDILVVDGTITNLAEPQLIKLNRSKADPLTGRFGTMPITKATVEVVMDSTVVIACHETEDGSYQLPSDFKGQIGHAYQLRFVLTDGTSYQSTPQTMLAAPPISRVYARFNPTSLSTREALDGNFRAAHDFYLDTQDPANQQNYYRWDWKLWERQEWCRSCSMGIYSVHNVLTKYTANGLRYFEAGDSLFENCFYPPPGTPGLDKYFVYDYQCRTQCWDIFVSNNLNVFADTYTNGALLTGQKVAQIPYYQHAPCLVEIRQAALNPAAYRYFNQLAEQTQKSGGVADLPPTTLAGNVQITAGKGSGVVGYFTASAVTTIRYWLNRKDATGLPLGATDPKGSSGLPGAELFYALNLRQPNPEPSFFSPNVSINDYSAHTKPYTAVCESNESQTPVKPIGWQD
ncbi:DUF4249 family protein [Spirosoma sp. HMF4905]|uniref:DUF4249 family protein n=1 Tax=Spirosoma arboris TaxID=2682092 RepID=A0A7K1SPH4_9BACT|nr:DUF4249 domain-containing protein [Spirosoma arboris]MVM35722.1 DUF4249 family protein [Spirosoma arboris]